MNANYSDFTVKPSSDFVGIKFKTATKTNLKGVRPRIAKALAIDVEHAGADLLDEDAQHAASDFLIKVQNPKSPADALVVMERLCDLFDLEEAPRVVMHEIAVDLTKPGATARELAEIVADLFLMHDHHVSSNVRLKRTYANGLPLDRESLIKRLMSGWQIAIGSQRAHKARGRVRRPNAVSMQLYVKTTDGGAPLPPERWSARMEVRLQGDDLPLDHAALAERFDLDRIADLFKFRTLRDDLDPKTARRHRRSAAPLFHRHETSAESHRRQHHPDTKANSALNKRFADSLRRLGKVWACGNLRSNESPNRATTEETARNAINCNVQPLSIDSLESLFPELSLPDSDEDQRIAALMDLGALEGSAGTAAPARSSQLDEWRNDGRLDANRVIFCPHDMAAHPEWLFFGRHHEEGRYGPGNRHTRIHGPRRRRRALPRHRVRRVADIQRQGTV